MAKKNYKELSGDVQPEETRFNDEQWQRFLLQLIDLIQSLKIPEAIAQAAMDLLLAIIKVKQASYVEILPAVDSFKTLAFAKNSDSSTAFRLQFSDLSVDEILDLEGGKSIVFHNQITDMQPEEKDTGKLYSGFAIPVIKQSQLVALLVLWNDFKQDWADSEVLMLQEVAKHIWIAMDRVKTEENLRISEKRFQSVANLVPDLLWDSEPDGSTNWYNLRRLEYTGQSFEEAIGWGWVDAIHPDDRGGSVRGYAAAVENGQAFQQEHRIRRHDGEYRWFIVNAYPIFNADGNVVKMYGAATDIHDRIQAEENLIKSEAKYRTLFDTIDEGFALMELVRNEQGSVIDLIYRDVNESFKRFTGWEAAIDQRGSVLMPYLEKALLRQMQMVVDTAKPFRKEDYVADLDRWYDVHYSAIGPPGGNFIVAVFNNTTNRKKTEEALQESERRQAFLLQLSDYLRPLTNPVAIQKTAAQQVLKETDADWVYYFSIDSEKEKISSIHGAAKHDPVIIPTDRSISVLNSIAGFEPGKTVFCNDVHLNSGFKDANHEYWPFLDAKAYISVPLVKNKELVAVLIVAVQLSRQWKKWEVELIEEVAQRTWASVARAKAETALHQAQSNYRIQLEKAVNDRTAKLNESNLLLRKSEEIAKLGSWEYHLESGIFNWSEGMYQLFGLERDATISADIYLQHATAESRLVAERILEHLRNGYADFEETIEIRVAEEYKILHLKALVVTDANGKAERILGVDLDITAIRRAEEKIRKMEAEQKLEIFRTSLSTLEEERHRISESLHNGIGQILYGIKINLSALRPDILGDEFNEAKKYVSGLLTDAIIETRRISHELMPTTLEQFGLKSAIDDICRQLNDGTKFICNVSGPHTRIEKYLELAVYRTVQELMMNVVKHAKATECHVQVIIASDAIAISVVDNGKGISPLALSKHGIGLASIRSKIKLLDGIINIDSTPDQGTAVKITIPLADANRA